MDFRALWPFHVLLAAVCLLPLSNGQCSLDVGDLTSITSIPFNTIFSEYTDTSFIQRDLTYLCYVRSQADNETFSEIRVSVLYQYQLSNGTLQLTLNCFLSMWWYNGSRPSLSELSAADHVTTNMTREGCQDCRDNNTASFGDPTYCRLPDPCAGPSVVCANGGTCSRTGLAETGCQCAGGWSGPGCDECNVMCSAGQTLDQQMCSCVGPTAPPLSPGAIVGIVIGSFAVLAIILAIITIVVIILVVDRKRRYTRA